MDPARAMDPVRFRFRDEQDIERYGERWFVYSEPDLIRWPARDLMELELALGFPVIEMMNGVRARSLVGDTAACWVGVRSEDPELAGPFETFNPRILLVEWGGSVPESEPEPEVGKDPASATSLPSDPRLPGTSARTDTVVLPNLPVVESRP